MPENLGKIEATEVPWLKDQGAKLDMLIGSMPELKARVDSLSNPTTTADNLQTMVNSWNGEHDGVRGMYVERVFTGSNSMKLKVKMDQQGNIELASEIK